jgi:hypothetical protein
MVLGDCVGNHHAAFMAPGLGLGSDQDRDTAAQTRLGLMDQLATEQSRIIGFHLPGGGMGRAERDGEAFRFVEDAQ